MSAKAIHEFDGKRLLGHWLEGAGASGLARVHFDTSILRKGSPGEWERHLTAELLRVQTLHPWLLTQRLVAKPDQLIKRRGKAGLLAIDVDWPAARDWLKPRAGTCVQVII